MSLMDVFVKIGADTSDLESGVKKSEGIVGKLGQGFGNAMKVAGAAVGAASAAVGAFAVSSVKAGATFDSSMAQVAATMGMTVEQLNATEEQMASMSEAEREAARTAQESFGQLRNFAQQMGATTAFSATQAADALNYMALAGYDAETSMSMLPNVLNLAAAGNMELATASDMVTDAQSALGLDLKETTQLVDMMAKTSSKSNTSVQQLGEAMLTIGGTAKTLSGGTNELSTALGILANNGIKGAEGGTKLRNIVLSLSAPTDKAAQMLESLGVSTVDATGNLRPLQEIMGELSKSLDGMGTADKADIINTIFNKQDIAGVNALLDTSIKDWNDLSAAIDDSAGAAEKMAKTQLDNLEGDITLFKSALEGAQIQISDFLTPALRKFVQFGTEKLGVLTDFIANGGLTQVLDKVKEGFTRITDALSPLTEKFSGLSLSENSAQSALDLLSGAFDAFIQVLAVGSQAIADIITGISEFVKWINSGSAGAETFKTIIIAVTAAVVAYKTAMGIAGVIMGVVKAIQAFNVVGALTKVWITAATVAQQAWNVVMSLNPIGILIAAITALVAAFIYLWNTNEDFRNFWIGLWEGIKEAASAAVEAIISFFTETIPNALQSVIDWIKSNWQSIVLFLVNPFAGLFKYFYDNSSKFKEFVDNAINNIKELPTKIAQIFVSVIEKVATFIRTFAEKAREAAKTFFNNLVNGITSLPSRLSALGNQLVGAVSNLPSKFMQVGKNIVDGLWNGISNGWNWLKDKVAGLADSLFQGAKDALGIHSPSKKFMWVGQMIDEGLASGIEKFSYLVDGSLGKLGAVSYVNSIDGEPQLAFAGGYNGGYGGDYNQTVNIYSPTALTPSEVARQTRNATRDMVLELRGKR